DPADRTAQTYPRRFRSSRPDIREVPIVARGNVAGAGSIAADDRSGAIPGGRPVRAVNHSADTLPDRFGHRDPTASRKVLEAAMLCRMQLNLSLDHGIPSHSDVMISLVAGGGGCGIKMVD